MSAPIPKAAFQDGTAQSAKVKRRYTREENNLIAELYESGVPPVQIAARLGIPHETIKTKISSWGMAGKYRPDCAGPRA